MHDILKGVAQYEVKLFEYLNRNFISNEHILQRVYAFNYGFMEKRIVQRTLTCFALATVLGLMLIKHHASFGTSH